MDVDCYDLPGLPVRPLPSPTALFLARGISEFDTRAPLSVSTLFFAYSTANLPQDMLSDTLSAQPGMGQ